MAAEEYDLLTRIWIKVRRNPLEIFMLIILIICVIAAVILAIEVLVKLNDNRKCTSNFSIIYDRKIMGEMWASNYSLKQPNFSRIYTNCK